MIFFLTYFFTQIAEAENLFFSESNNKRHGKTNAIAKYLFHAELKTGGDAFTFAKLWELFENAGFSNNEHIPLSPMPQRLVVSVK